jgi:hypothetical protein
MRAANQRSAQRHDSPARASTQAQPSVECNRERTKATLSQGLGNRGAIGEWGAAQDELWHPRLALDEE